MATPSRNGEDSFDDLLLAIVDKLARKAYDLPPLPHIASRVLALTTDSDADVLQLTELIQQDPVLTAKIFQISNSVAHGASRKIESLPQAVAWLGLNTVAGSAYAVSVQSGVFNVRGYEQEVKGLWTHALASGFYGKTIANHIGSNPDMGFLCGLLHGIGKPFVVHTVNQCQKNSSTHIPWTAMLTLFKDSYVEVGRQLALEWEFPDPVKEAINLHEDHAFHLSTSADAAITNLAHHFANQFVDLQENSQDTLRSLPVVQALAISESSMESLWDLHDTIRTQVETMLI